jgi:hypothetical protein
LRAVSDRLQTTGWQPIETAPKNGRVIPCCWAGSPEWIPLRWKHNRRIDRAYFGDPDEYDDYNLVDEPPTHWFDLPEIPVK